MHPCHKRGNPPPKPTTASPGSAAAECQSMERGVTIGTLRRLQDYETPMRCRRPSPEAESPTSSARFPPKPAKPISPPGVSRPRPTPMDGRGCLSSWVIAAYWKARDECGAMRRIRDCERPMSRRRSSTAPRQDHGDADLSEGALAADPADICHGHARQPDIGLARDPNLTSRSMPHRFRTILPMPRTAPPATGRLRTCRPRAQSRPRGAKPVPEHGVSRPSGQA